MPKAGREDRIGRIEPLFRRRKQIAKGAHPRWFVKQKFPWRRLGRRSLMPSKPISGPRQHAYSGPVQPQLPEPSHAERLRTLITLATVGTLSTISRKHPGFPFGSLMPFAIDDAGRPIFLISEMAMHTQNLNTEPRCSLFVGQ